MDETLTLKEKEEIVKFIAKVSHEDYERIKSGKQYHSDMSYLVYRALSKMEAQQRRFIVNTYFCKNEEICVNDASKRLSIDVFLENLELQ